MDEFGISTCLVGIGEGGENRLAEGFEDRESDAKMVPDSEIDADKRHVRTGEIVENAEFASFDLVVVTGDVSDDDSVETAADIGDSCDSEAVSVVLVAGEPAEAELQPLTRSFGTVIVVETGRWVQELLTDLFTLYSQSMMLHTDYTRINTNLKQGGVASICRATGDREEIENIVESCSGLSDDVLVGYAEVGSEFTVGDAEELEVLFGDELVVGGQATLSDDTGIRLTLLKRASVV